MANLKEPYFALLCRVRTGRWPDWTTSKHKNMIVSPGHQMICNCCQQCITHLLGLVLWAGQAGADGQAGQQGAMLQRSKWTAQVGLVLHSQVPSPLAGYVLPPGEHHCFALLWSSLIGLADRALSVVASMSSHRLRRQVKRKEKSAPVGVFHGRPWIDQWHPSPLIQGTFQEGVVGKNPLRRFSPSRILKLTLPDGDGNSVPPSALTPYRLCPALG